MSKAILGLIVVVLILLIFGSIFFIYQGKYLVGRASVSRQSFSVENSYMFVSPLRAKANNTERIRVTVFILNDQGLGVPGKPVEISRNPGIAIEVSQGLTDDYGKAVFDVTSANPGEYYLEVTVEGRLLPQRAHLSFY